jgi:hypothetical protein
MKTYRAISKAYFSLDIIYMISNVKVIVQKSVDVIIATPKYYLLASIVEIVVFVLLIYKWNPYNISTTFPVFCELFIILLGFIQLITYLLVKNKNMFAQDKTTITPTFMEMVVKVLFTVLSSGLLVAGIYGLVLLITHIPSIHKIITISIDLFVVVGILALLYVFIKPLIEKSNNPAGRASIMSLIGSLIMYIPCAMIDVIDWAKNQYNITTKTVWIILAVEAFLISIRIILPKLMTLMTNIDGVVLLKEPVYLDKMHTLGSFDVLHDTDTRAYHYSISAWFWLNPQPPNTRAAYTKFTNILEFGRKPAVEFNGLENVLRVSCNIKGNEESTIYETREIPYQAWNNIVINYDGGTMDVFLNGVLVGSQPDIAPYMSYENIIVGENNGIEGGICNVTYTKHIIQARQIENIYKALRSMPNPVI